MNKLPITVVVPLSKKRINFFENYCLPSIELNNPAEIIIEDYDGTASVKRNSGAAKSTQDFVFYCDDDHILSKNCLVKMYEQLLKNPHIAYSYANYQAIVLCENDQKLSHFILNAGRFSHKRLKERNFIDSSCLIRKSDLMFFDESIQGLEDWDLWLTMAEHKKNGIWVDEILYHKYFLEEGISFKMNEPSQIRKIKKKHNIK